MSDDNAVVIRIKTQAKCRLGGNILMADAVESVTAHRMLFVIFMRQGVKVSARGHGLMECGIEGNDLGQVRARLAGSSNADQVRWRMQGGERFAAPYFLDDIVRHQGWLPEKTAAMNNPVAHGNDVIFQAQLLQIRKYPSDSG